MRRYRAMLASHDRGTRRRNAHRMSVLGWIAGQAYRPAVPSRRHRRRAVVYGLRQQHSGLQQLPSCRTVLRRRSHGRDVLQPARRGFVAIGRQPIRKRQASAGRGAPAGRRGLRSTPRRMKEQQHRAHRSVARPCAGSAPPHEGFCAPVICFYLASAGTDGRHLDTPAVPVQVRLMRGAREAAAESGGGSA